jgi:hypothetical protein
MSEGLTPSELQVLQGLLQRFAEHELDQFEHLRFDTSYGPVFVSWTRKLPPGWSAEAFTPVPRPAPGKTGRVAHAGKAATAHSREDLLRVITQMRDDLAGTGAHEWENPSLERFLEALQGFLADLDGYYASRGQQPPAQPPAQPDWGLLATALVAATGYE